MEKFFFFNINDLPYRIKREFLNSGKMTSKSIFQYRLIRIDYLTRPKIFCKQNKNEIFRIHHANIYDVTFIHTDIICI